MDRYLEQYLYKVPQRRCGLGDRDVLFWWSDLWRRGLVARRTRRGSETEALAASLTPEERQEFAVLDLQRLVLEKEGMAPEYAARVEEPAYGVLSSLRLWENLIYDMEQEWPGQDFYLVYEYLLDLTVRDGLEEYCEALHGKPRAKFRRALGRLDERYRAVTYEDGGAELGQYWRPLSEGTETRWWWTRRPNDLPPNW
ncbi:hypothetical protein [Sphaerisporangium sp. NPDC051011]|uniref:hypothetical protein n=1 Tax=Sphaerisporangium sp. NPDC051011 TaxID=3155792 RepID=UPI0033CEB7C7